MVEAGLMRIANSLKLGHFIQIGNCNAASKSEFLGRARICNPDTDLKTCADNATGN
jgi:hypothetical protein